MKILTNLFRGNRFYRFGSVAFNYNTNIVWSFAVYNTSYKCNYYAKADKKNTKPFTALRFMLFQL